MIRGAIFDVDGTLLDSMPIWENVGETYLRQRGIVPLPGLGEKLFPMSLEDAADYMKREYGLPETIAEIVNGAVEVIAHFYKEEAPLKPGVREFLRALHEQGVKMVIATSGDQKLAGAALERLGVRSYFRKIFTCTEVGAGKSRPDIYLQAQKYLGTRREETWVFEDALHAMETVKRAGFPLAGVFDPSNEGQLDRSREICDFYMEKLDCFERFWKVANETANGTANEDANEVTNEVGGRKGRRMRTALTIAGSDSSGGAGIQADIKTMTANGVFAMSAITALTAQNTTGVTDIMEVTPAFLGAQMDNIFTDIRPDAVKIGMVSGSGLIRKIAEKLREYQAENIVVDPVMVATSGAKLISDEAIATLKSELLPMAAVLTPNIPEAEVLSGMEIHTEEEMVEAAKVISEGYHCAVLLKGGHQLNDANDLLYRNGSYKWFYGKRIDNPNTHGTGCTLSSAMASNLAKGFDLDTSVERAKAYISGALGAMLDLGKGSGPMNHAFAITGEFTKEA